MSVISTARRDIFIKLNFDLIKNDRKYTARCLFCKQIITNIATERLQNHRNRCKPVQQKQSEIEIVDISSNGMELDNSFEISQMDISNNSQFEILEIVELSAPDVATTSSSCNAATTKTPAASSARTSLSAFPSERFSTTAPSSSSHTLSLTPSPSSLSSSTTPSSSSEIPSSPDSYFKRPAQKNSMKKFIDTLSKKEEAEINECIARFFYGCNIALNVVEAAPFKDLVKKLRPACAKSIPSRKALSTVLLDKEYDRQINITKSLLGKQSVLLIDGWKNTSSNTKLVVTMLHNANDEKAFLNAWDLSGEPENAERLAEIVDESCKLAQNLYSTTIYAVISDNAANMVKMGKTVNLWHSNCSAHVANLLSKDVLNKNVATNLLAVLKEFRHSDLEKGILEKGGSKIKIPAETRWCTHRDCCKCFKRNLKFMRELVIDGKKIKPAVKNLLFDDVFIEDVDKMIAVLDPVSTLLNKVQSTSCSLAEAADLWLSLNTNEPQLKEFFKSRRKQALNKYALTAYYLNPYYDKKKLDDEQVNIITSFLFDYLDGDGMKELDLYINLKEYFGVLYAKNLNNDASLFWRMCALKYPSISDLAKKLISLPASSAQLERVFSNWGYIHSDIRNRLTFDRSKKLLHIYYNMKINKNLDEEEEE